MKQDKRSKPSFRKQLQEAARQMDLPEGFGQGKPLLTWDGDLQLLIERHQGITEYGEERICVAAKTYTIQIGGAQMHLTAMDKDCICIRGHIHSVSYLYQE